jgi:hypothetical protein
MLKKVMIICLALSFVFIGGIGIALAADQEGRAMGPGPYGPPVWAPGDGTCQDFISPDSSIILADDCLGQPDGAGTGEGAPYGPRGDECPNFISHDSSIIIADAGGPQTAGPAPATNSHNGIHENGPGWPILDY